VALTVLTLLLAGQALATATPEITPEAVPLLTSPAYCSSAPANINRLIEIAHGAATPENAGILDELIPLDNAEPVTAQEADAVINLATTFIACVNANDELRALALVTDDLIERSGNTLVDTNDPSSLSDGSEPLDAEDQARIAGITDVYELPDGRYSVIVDLGPVTGEAPFARLQFVVVNQNGTYHIDDFRFQDIESEVIDCDSSQDDGCETPACGSPETDGCVAPEDATPVSGDGYSGWIMTPEQADSAALYFGINDEKYSGLAVRPDQIAQAEAALPAYLDGQERETDRLIDEIHTGVYERQYFGYAFEFSFLLVINGYCASESAYFNPSQQPVVVEDGGDCFWQATYSLTDERFISFSVNGFA
jgi:hypothetical protein